MLIVTVKKEGYIEKGEGKERNGSVVSNMTFFFFNHHGFSSTKMRLEKKSIFFLDTPSPHTFKYHHEKKNYLMSGLFTIQNITKFYQHNFNSRVKIVIHCCFIFL